LEFVLNLAKKPPDIALVGGKHGQCELLELGKIILVGKKSLRSFFALNG